MASLLMKHEVRYCKKSFGRKIAENYWLDKGTVYSETYEHPGETPTSYVVDPDNKNMQWQSLDREKYTCAWHFS